MIKLKIKEFFSFFSIFIIIFTILSWDFWFLNFKIFFDFSKENSIYSYNKSLFLAKNSDFSGSLINIPNFLPNFENRRLELEWDIFYELNYSTWEILQKYKNSQNIENNPRLEEKIKFLENSEKNFEKNSENSENQPNENEENFEENNELNNEIQKILQEQKNRQDYLNPYRIKELEYSSEVKRLKNLINENQDYGQKDW